MNRLQYTHVLANTVDEFAYMYIVHTYVNSDYNEYMCACEIIKTHLRTTENWKLNASNYGV